MTLHLITKKLKNRNLPILQTGLVLFCFIVILMAWILSLNQLNKSKTSLLHGLKQEQQNLTSILAENLFQILEQNRAIEVFALERLSGNKTIFSDVISSFLYGKRGFNRIVLYDPSGESLYMSSPGYNGELSQERIAQYIHQMVQNNTPRVVAPPTASPDSTWQIPILFPLTKDNGIYGVMLLELDLGYFITLFQRISIGRTGRITILNNQGSPLACFESGGLVIDGALFTDPLTMDLKNVSATEIITDKDLKAHHLTYRHVQDYPFTVVISQGLAEILSDFNQYKKAQLRILSMLTLFCLCGFYQILRMINRKQHYLMALTAANQENNELIAKLKNEHEKAVNAASFDPLTSLYNRRLFVSIAQKNLFLARRNRLSYAILFIDLDRFKTINDTLGHRIGDLLLQTVARRLVDCTRNSDIVSRFGGDEFVVMLTEIASDRDIPPIVQKIITTLSEPCENLEGQVVHTSPSIGVAVYPRDGENIDSLLVSADAAMYKSKQAGRGRYTFFDASLNTISVHEFELEQQMPSAIAHDEFVLYYQPKIRLKDYRVVGLEALIRWQHPDYQLIYPDGFIEMAEKTGLIVNLGNWVLEAACRQMAQWHADGLKIVPLAVNVSPKELKDKDYSQRFLKTLKKHQLSADHIEVEITENAFIKDKKVVIENLKTLFANGITISLDDYGNGFSSLNYIKSLPISVIKIDRSFIMDIRNNHDDNSIVSSTIVLAQKLNLIVVAEGIESHDQLVNLKVAGCDQVQGYYFSRPVPEREIREFIISPLRGPSE